MYNKKFINELYCKGKMNFEIEPRIAINNAHMKKELLETFNLYIVFIKVNKKHTSKNAKIGVSTLQNHSFSVVKKDINCCIVSYPLSY